MIGDLFKKWVDTVDPICFLVSSSSPRLTATQKYKFSSIVSLFGNDIIDNFIPMLTFCDGKEPQILASLLDDESTFKKSIYINYQLSSISYKMWQVNIRKKKKYFLDQKKWG